MKFKDDLTYSEAIEQVMLHNGFFAPLKLIYKDIWKFKDKSRIKGLTPNYTIQERVQRDKRFLKIGLGVYALAEHINKLPVALTPKNSEQRKLNLHAAIQGMLIEIGNSKSEIENTYTNDKSWIFANKTLGSLATLNDVPLFTFHKIVNETVRFFDVIWFNKRNYPFKIFEVEHSTDFRDAFIKFMELQDFRTNFCCISSANKEDKFRRELSKNAFEPLRSRCEFISYEKVENDYNIALSRTFL